MKKIPLLIFLLAALSSYAQRDSRIVVGTVDTFYSEVLNEKRIIQVHVPSGDKNQRYPVLYILDGEDHFLSSVAITEQMSGVIPPMIVVGINNMGFDDRERDMTPTADPGVAHSGGGDTFIRFMEKELIPYVSSKYPAASYRILSGHSLGGLAVVNTLFNHTPLFSAYIALDPSVWWDDQRWIKKQEPKLASVDFKGKSLFIAMANNIPPGLDTVSVLKSDDPISLLTRALIPFVHAVRDAKPAGLRWTSKFYPNERHGTVELISEYDALRYLFDYYQFRTSQFIGHPELDEDSVLEAHYKVISERLGYMVSPTESTVNELGYDCMGKHKMEQAYKLFIRNTRYYPDSSNAFDSLGDYYVAVGDKQKAIAAFQKALSLMETTDTRRKLNELTGNK